MGKGSKLITNRYKMLDEFSKKHAPFVDGYWFYCKGNIKNKTVTVDAVKMVPMEKMDRMEQEVTTLPICPLSCTEK